MTIKLYVNWSESKILTPKQFEEVLDKTVKERVADENAFLDYLAQYFTHIELFEMDEEEKENVKQDFQEHCEEIVHRELIESWYSDYEEITVELED